METQGTRSADPCTASTAAASLASTQQEQRKKACARPATTASCAEPLGECVCRGLMALRRLWRELPIADPRVDAEALSALRRRIQGARECADATAAQQALDTLRSGTEFCCEDCVLHAVRWGGGYDCCGAPPTYHHEVWIRRVLLNRARLVLLPLAAWRVQGAWRRHRRRECARRVIQNAALDFLWRPGAWAYGRGAAAVVIWH